MSVGKGSIKRAAQAKEAVKEGKKETVAEVAAVAEQAAPVKKEVADKETATKKEVTAKETAVKKEVTAKETAPVKKAAPAKKPAAKPAAKAPAKKAPAKSPARKDTVVAASVISSDDIHEKKFEAVSRIYCELPTYLL